jgi:hypothetical protein
VLKTLWQKEGSRSLCNLLLREVFKLSDSEYREVVQFVDNSQGLAGMYQSNDEPGSYVLAIELPRSNIGKVVGGLAGGAAFALGGGLLLHKNRQAIMDRMGKANQTKEATKETEENLALRLQLEAQTGENGRLQSRLVEVESELTGEKAAHAALNVDLEAERRRASELQQQLAAMPGQLEIKDREHARLKDELQDARRIQGELQSTLDTERQQRSTIDADNASLNLELQAVRARRVEFQATEQQKLETKDADNSRLKDELQAVRDRLSELQATWDNEQQQWLTKEASLNRELQAARESQSELQSLIDAQQKEHREELRKLQENLGTQSSRHEVEMQALRARLALETLSNDTLRAELSSKNSTTANLERQVGEMKALQAESGVNLATLLATQAETIRGLSAANEKIVELEQENAQLRSEIEQISQTREQSERAELEKDHQLVNQQELFAREKELLAATARALQTRLEHLEGGLQSANARQSELHTALEAATKSNDALQAEFARREANLQAELQAELKKKEREVLALQALQKKDGTLQATLDARSLELQDSHKLLHKKEEELRDLNGKLEAKQARELEFIKKHGEINQMTERVGELQASVSELTLHKAQLEASIEVQKEELRILVGNKEPEKNSIQAKKVSQSSPGQTKVPVSPEKGSGLSDNAQRDPTRSDENKKPEQPPSREVPDLPKPGSPLNEKPNYADIGVFNIKEFTTGPKLLQEICNFKDISSKSKVFFTSNCPLPVEIFTDQFMSDLKKCTHDKMQFIFENLSLDIRKVEQAQLTNLLNQNNGRKFANLTIIVGQMEFKPRPVFGAKVWANAIQSTPVNFKGITAEMADNLRMQLASHNRVESFVEFCNDLRLSPPNIAIDVDSMTLDLLYSQLTYLNAFLAKQERKTEFQTWLYYTKHEGVQKGDIIRWFISGGRVATKPDFGGYECPEYGFQHLGKIYVNNVNIKIKPLDPCIVWEFEYMLPPFCTVGDQVLYNRKVVSIPDNGGDQVKLQPSAKPQNVGHAEITFEDMVIARFKNGPAAFSDELCALLRKDGSKQINIRSTCPLPVKMFTDQFVSDMDKCRRQGALPFLNFTNLILDTRLVTPEHVLNMLKHYHNKTIQKLTIMVGSDRDYSKLKGLHSYSANKIFVQLANKEYSLNGIIQFWRDMGLFEIEYIIVNLDEIDNPYERLKDLKRHWQKDFPRRKLTTLLYTQKNDYTDGTFVTWYIHFGFKMVEPDWSRYKQPDELSDLGPFYINNRKVETSDRKWRFKYFKAETCKVMNSEIYMIVDPID